MLILTLRTDKPEAELGLYEDGIQIDYTSWQAHRALAETIHLKIKDLLGTHAKVLHDIGGIVIYRGPGSFTGLRIGMSVANAAAQTLRIPISATTTEAWITVGIAELTTGPRHDIVVPQYGAPVHTTAPRK